MSSSSTAAQTEHTGMRTPAQGPFKKLETPKAGPPAWPCAGVCQDARICTQTDDGSVPVSARPAKDGLVRGLAAVRPCGSGACRADRLHGPAAGNHEESRIPDQLCPDLHMDPGGRPKAV